MKERKRKEYDNLFIDKLISSIDDQKEFWQTLKTVVPRRTYIKNEIDQEDWFNYFKELLDKEDELAGINENAEQVEPNENREFNNPISQEEVLSALNKLKPRKAAGPDTIIGEILKNAKEEIAPFFVKLFNHLFDNGIYPRNWTESIILPLHKKGDVNDPGNYRGISLSDISSKIYGSIINKRIQSWVDEHNITGEIRGGPHKSCNTGKPLTSQTRSSR